MYKSLFDLHCATTAYALEKGRSPLTFNELEAIEEAMRDVLLEDILDFDASHVYNNYVVYTDAKEAAMFEVDIGLAHVASNGYVVDFL